MKKKNLRKYISVLVVFVFLVQVLTFSGHALEMANMTEEESRNMSFIAGQVSHMKDLCETMGKEAYVENLKMNLMNKRSAIVGNIMNKIKEEGIDKVEADLKTLGPIGENIASDLEMCKTDAQKYEMIRLNLNHHLGILVKRIGDMKEGDIKEELNDFEQRIHDTASGKEMVSEGKRKPLISFEFIDVNRQKNTEGIVTGAVSGVFKITMGIFKVGVALFIFLLNAIVFIAKGMIPLAVFMLNIGVGLLKITVGMITGLLRLLF